MSTSVEQLSSMLSELRDEIQVRNNPERQALALLGQKHGGYGKTELPYSDNAFRIWEQVLSRSEDDLRTVHHLAIMHHARAFDLEQSDDPDSSDADWEIALRLWHRLWAEDAYWQELSARIGEDAFNPFIDARAKLPQRVLGVHFDIAFDTQCKHYRARRHVNLALASAFPDDAKHAVRAKCYGHAISGLPVAAWDPTTFDEGTLLPSLDGILAYLSIDEGFVMALADLLQLLTKLQTGHVQRVNATAGPEEFERSLRSARAIDDRYDPFVRHLETQLHALAPDVLANLIFWNSRGGQALRLSEFYDLGAERYARARAAALQDGSDPDHARELHDEQCQCLALAAAECASEGITGGERAREFLSRLPGDTDLSGDCILLRAQARLLLGDYEAVAHDVDLARSVAEREKASLDWQIAEKGAALESNCNQLSTIIERTRKRHATHDHIQRAEGEMHGDRWTEAIGLLNIALEVDPESLAALVHRAECMLQELDLSQARIDLDHAQALAAEQDDEPALEAIRELRPLIEDVQDQIDTFGGAESLSLRRQAVEAYNIGAPENAVDLLRRAIELADPSGHAALNRELSMCVDAVGQKKLAAAMGRNLPTLPTVFRNSFAEIEGLFQEALRLDPENARARKSLDDVREMIAQWKFLKEDTGEVS